jgi:hypothetical protein
LSPLLEKLKDVVRIGALSSEGRISSMLSLRKTERISGDLRSHLVSDVWAR